MRGVLRPSHSGAGRERRAHERRSPGDQHPPVGDHHPHHRAPGHQDARAARWPTAPRRPVPAESSSPLMTARRLTAGVTAALTALVVLTGCGGSSSSTSSSASTQSRSSSSTPLLTSTTPATPAARTVAAPLCDPAPCQLTHAELAAELDDLCVRGNGAVKQAEAGFEQATNAGDYTKAAAAMKSALREFPPYQFAILGLTPRAQDRATFTRYVDLTRQTHELSERIVAAGRARDPAEIIRLSQLVQQDLATRTRVADDLGTKHCGL
jgi:hypothetical protein